jgi:hypothetical protein
MAELWGACGLDCGACPAYVATQASDDEKIAAISRQWSEEYGGDIKPEHVWCDGCIPGGERACAHVAECKIRACAVERGLANCAACADYGCEILAGLHEMAPEARANLEEVRGSS